MNSKDILYIVMWSMFNFAFKIDYYFQKLNLQNQLEYVITIILAHLSNYKLINQLINKLIKFNINQIVKILTFTEPKMLNGIDIKETMAMTSFGQKTTLANFFKSQNVRRYGPALLNNVQSYKPGMLKEVDSKRVLLGKDPSSQKFTIYLPAFLRLKVNQIISIEPQSTLANIYGTIWLTIKYGNLGFDIQSILNQLVVLDIKLNQSLRLSGRDNQSISVINILQKSQMHYIIRNWPLKLSIVPHTYLTPFEFMQLFLNIKIPKIKLQRQFQDVDYIKFNLQDTKFTQSKISYENNIKVLDYLLAPGLLKASYNNKQIKSTDQQINKEQPISMTITTNPDKQDPMASSTQLQREETLLKSSSQFFEQFSFDSFCFASFKIPLYRQPLGYILSIFGFMVILGLLTIGIYYQQNSVSGRISSIATIAIAFGTTYIAVRQSNRFKTQFTFTEYCIFLQMVACILPILQTLKIQGEQNYTFDWKKDVFYILTVIIQILVISSTILLTIIHFLIWKRNYYQLEYDFQERQHQRQRVWGNQVCNQKIRAFNLKNQHFSIQIYQQIYQQKQEPLKEQSADGPSMIDQNDRTKQLEQLDQAAKKIQYIRHQLQRKRRQQRGQQTQNVCC